MIVLTCCFIFYRLTYVSEKLAVSWMLMGLLFLFTVLVDDLKCSMLGSALDKKQIEQNRKLA